MGAQLGGGGRGSHGKSAPCGGTPTCLPSKGCLAPPWPALGGDPPSPCTPLCEVVGGGVERCLDDLGAPKNPPCPQGCLPKMAIFGRFSKLRKVGGHTSLDMRAFGGGEGVGDSWEWGLSNEGFRSKVGSKVVGRQGCKVGCLLFLSSLGGGEVRVRFWGEVCGVPPPLQARFGA